MTLKAKLFALIAAGLVAIGLMTGTTFYTMQSLKFSLDEVGSNRLPSIEGLYEIEANALQIRVINLNAAVWENDYKAQDKFAGLLPQKQVAWGSLDKGWKKYDALPQEPEEAQVWKQFEQSFAEWKSADSRLTELLSQLSRNTDAKKQAEIFVDFYKARDLAAPSFAKASELLGKVIELNSKYGDIAVKAGERTADTVKTLTIVIALLAAVSVFLIGLFILRSTFKQLGGEPALATDIANKIARGDLSSEIALATGDTSSLLSAMKRMSDAINALTVDAGLLAKAAVDGKLATRADASKHQGDFQKVVTGVNNTLDAVIGPLNVAAKYVDDISRGAIPAKITAPYNGDFNTLKNNLNTCIDAVNALVADAGLLAKAAVEGKLATRADARKHQGDFQKVVSGVNNTLDAVIGPLNVAAGYVDRISKGDIPPKITDPYNGDFNILKNNLNTCIDAVNALVADAGMLSKAAVEGKLATRADASKHQGDFQKIVAGVNHTLDAVIGPLNVAAGYVDRISKGDIPLKITDPYNGDFNILKNNLNTCIDAVNALVIDALMLANAAVEGRLETRADASKHQGDFQKIVKGVNDTLDNVVGPINEVRRIMEAMSGGDLSQTIHTAYRGDFDELKNAINQTVVKLVGIIGEVRTAADNLTNAAGQVSATAQSLSQSSSEQAASVEETTSSMEQMTASISQNTENAKVTDGMASKAAKEAAEGGEAVTKTVDDMKSIASKIGIIDDIAYQTNLLALNAAIEAARAGDHGKGFAVVAAEVRKLAERSQVAAQEIGNLASSSVKQAERAGTLLTEMVPTIRKTSDLVQEIASASSEQSSGVAQINGAMGQLNQATQQNASASEQLAATAEELGAQAEQLQQTMTFFHLDDNPRHSARKAPPTARSSSGKAKPPVSARTAAVQVNEGDFERY